jgi:hypothetical protein
MSLSSDFVEFIECLNRKRVEYLLVGGHALAFHGVPRFTKDIDFWVRPERANASRLLEALAEFGFSSTGLIVDDFATPGKIVQLGIEPNRIDLITRVDGVEFDEAWSQRIATTYHYVALHVLSLPLLIANKRSTGRDQDALDAKMLEAVLARMTAG